MKNNFITEITLRGFFHQCTNKDKQWWSDNQQNDYFLNSEEALQLGIIDKII